MTENLQQQQSVAENFSRELHSYFALCLLNLVFGALAMAFGMQFIVTAIIAMSGPGAFGIFPFLQALLGWAAVVIGFRWILSSARILKGVTGIRREYRELGTPVSDEAVTGLIVRMMAHYRENWKTIWRMNLIAILGGTIFLVLGVSNLLQGISAWYAGTGLPSFLAFVAAAINLTIGATSLLFSVWFRRYARAWELRLIEAGHSEETLKHSMEQG
ncbi:MAG TPA: hypothetical protein VMS81_03715 [Methanomicrobiales archaeon]|jgi:hypothetical protein|nr:hypothetical protein [Methanomicrobiales archaeon]